MGGVEFLMRLRVAAGVKSPVSMSVGSRELGSKALRGSRPMGGGLCASDIFTITCHLQRLNKKCIVYNRVKYELIVFSNLLGLNRVI